MPLLQAGRREPPGVGRLARAGCTLRIVVFAVPPHAALMPLRGCRDTQRSQAPVQAAAPAISGTGRPRLLRNARSTPLRLSWPCPRPCNGQGTGAPAAAVMGLLHAAMPFGAATTSRRRLTAVTAAACGTRTCQAAEGWRASVLFPIGGAHVVCSRHPSLVLHGWPAVGATTWSADCTAPTAGEAPTIGQWRYRKLALRRRQRRGRHLLATCQ
mmetsp:Transcript_2411/g.6866  ORF Transcript_2411/g.6866 Transcript_2411/m.6866 type:complete len:213 (-) Transcript_2411:1068-1706(-)